MRRLDLIRQCRGVVYGTIHDIESANETIIAATKDAADSVRINEYTKTSLLVGGNSRPADNVRCGPEIHRQHRVVGRVRVDGHGEIDHAAKVIGRRGDVAKPVVIQVILDPAVDRA